MNIITFKPIKLLLTFFLLLIFFLSSCGPLAFKRSDVKDNPIKESEKRKKNIDEGRGASCKFGGRESGKFEFASSNELWRATIEILDFAPFTNADYGGGIVITDWYSDNSNNKESIKISVQFLSNEIRADALSVKVYKKRCSKAQNCTISKIESNINQEIKLAILKKAAQLKKNYRKKQVEEDGGYKIQKNQQ